MLTATMMLLCVAVATGLWGVDLAHDPSSVLARRARQVSRLALAMFLVMLVILDMR